MPANVLWGLGFGILYVTSLIFWPAALLLSALLAFPTVGLFRMAALIVRQEGVSFWDGVRAWRELFVPTLVAGVSIVLFTLVFLANLFGGLQSGDLLGLAFATLAAWGLVIGWLWVICFWPLLTDPRRQDWGFPRGPARASGFTWSSRIPFALGWAGSRGSS